jgi:hypothetical protein
MEIVHGIEAMALYPLCLTEILGSSVTVVGAVLSMYLIVDIATRTPAGWLAVGPIASGFIWDQVHHYAPFLAGAILLLVATALSLRIRADLHSDRKPAIISKVTEGENRNE